MDDEAASQQLMSEARATHITKQNDDAIPLSLAGANSPKHRKKKSKKSKKREKLDRPKSPEKPHLVEEQTGPSQVPTYALADLQALVAKSPPQSQNLPPTAPSTQIEVPDTQVSNAALMDTAKPEVTKSKRKREVEADVQDEIIPATPHKVTDQGRSGQKRRKKRRSQPSVHNVNADATEVGSTPGATQDVSSQLASGEEQGGAPPAPLTPKDLLQNLKDERLQKSQGSQSNGSPPTSAQRKKEAADTMPADVHVEEHAMDMEEERPSTSGAETAEKVSSATQSVSKKKRTRKNRDILEAPKLDWDAPVRNLSDTPSQPFPILDIDATEPTESPHRERKKRKREGKTKMSTDGTKSSRRSVGGPSKSPSKRPSKHDPNKNYERARDEDDRTAADKALEASHDLGHPPELRTSGDYSVDENELLRRAIRDFQQREDLETAELVRIIQFVPSREDATEADITDQAGSELKKQSAAFWEEIKGAGLWRSIKYVKEHVRADYHMCQRGPWSADEDEELRRLVALHPNKWKLIAAPLNRLRRDVFNRWNDYVQHGEDRVTKRWSLEEEDSFVNVLSTVCQRAEDYRAETGEPPLDDYLSVLNWSEVCKEMGNTRSRLQCQYKLRQMRERVPPISFVLQIKPRRTSSPDEIDAKSEDGDQVNGEAEPGKKMVEQHGAVPVKKPAKKQSKKQAKREDFKSRELVTESDNAESEHEV